MLRGLYGDIQISQMVTTLPSCCGLKDKLLWTGHASGDYSVSAGYKWLISNGLRIGVSCLRPSVFPWKDYWKGKLPYRVLVFGWRVLNDAIPTKEKLYRYHIGVGGLCLFCNDNDETIDHIMLHCPFSKAVWFGLNKGFSVPK